MDFLITHSHRHGTDTFVVSSANEPSDEQIVRFLNAKGAGFEPEIGEEFDCNAITEKHVID